MPSHNFGIMQTQPQKGERFNRYEPQRYSCISVDDDDLLPLLEKFEEVKCYWHTLDRAETGLAYCGITLIPPESLGSLIENIWSDQNLSELLSLFSLAEKENKFVIHFGI